MAGSESLIVYDFPMADDQASIGDGETVGRGPETSRPSYERFSPGDVLDDRYRIVALLGKGGMGEVYRADDLKLGQPVALKFLPRDVYNASAIQRLYKEVRLGRKISHPNVCRLYDVGEWQGNHFVTMELIDGEDLASLLRRIGQIPHGKAVELAQDICAGLAAAHGLGVVHRDLKPANIMIDGRGNAIITDFGLASLAEDLEGRSEVAGTPAYMAPEQLRGGEVTHKSDLYSLGLILYEMFTGHRKFEGRSIDEIRRLHESSDSSITSRETKSVDPVIQQVVVRCLEPDPNERPRSIHSVIAALPGADPLQAAVEAGDTPSPEMVAAAGRSGELSVGQGIGLVIAALSLLLAVVWLKERTELYGVRPLPKHPRVLEAEAKQTLELTGFTGQVRDTSYYLGLEREWVLAPPDQRKAFDVTTVLPSPLAFYYRQSPEALVPFWGNVGDRRVLPDDPPNTLPGMARVTLSPEGRLSNLLIVPDIEGLVTGIEPRWERLFERAGLDYGAAREVDPRLPAPVGSDRRVSWETRYLGEDGRQVRVDAAALGGQIVWFDVAPPWQGEALRDRLSYSLFSFAAPADVVVTIVIIIALVSAIWFARRNLRRGRGDRKGAVRLWIAVFLALSSSYLLRADLHGPLPHTWLVMTERIGLALYRAFVIAILYLAIEPYLRRRWPTLLVSWSRLLAGRWRDPLVGRHVLIGAIGAILVAVLDALPRVLSSDAAVAPGAWQSTLTSGRQALALAIGAVASGVLPAFVLCALMVGVAVLFHRRIAGAAGVGILIVLVPFLGAMASGEVTPWLIVSVVLPAVIITAILFRVGLLAAFVYFATERLIDFPLTLDTDAFFFPTSALVLGVLFALLAWGFAVSIDAAPQRIAALESAGSLEREV